MSYRETQRQSDGFGREVFPLKPARRIGETTYITCQQCGFAVDTQSRTFSKEAAGEVENINEGTGPKGGCPLCLSTNWAPFKRKLKDANDTSTKRSDRRRLR